MTNPHTADQAHLSAADGVLPETGETASKIRSNTTAEPPEPVPDPTVRELARALRSILIEHATFDDVLVSPIDEATLRGMAALLPAELLADQLARGRRFDEQRARAVQPPSPGPSPHDLRVTAWQERLDAGWRQDLDAVLDAVPMPPWITVPFVDAVALVVEGSTTVEWGRTADEVFTKHLDHLRRMTATASELAEGWELQDETAAEMLGRSVLGGWGLFRMRMPPGMLAFLSNTDPVRLGPVESSVRPFCTLLRERLEAMESTAGDLAAELDRIGCRVAVERIEAWLGGSAVPDGWQVSALADALVLLVEERNAWIASARCGGVR